MRSVKENQRYWYERNIFYGGFERYPYSEGRTFLETIEEINGDLRERGIPIRYGPCLETEAPTSWAFTNAGIHFDPITRTRRGVGLYTAGEKTTQDGTHMTLDDALSEFEVRQMEREE